MSDVPPLVALTINSLSGRRWLFHPRRINRLLARQARFERYYILDYQMVCYLEVPLERLRGLVPQGFQPFRVNEMTGVFYITYMNILEGNRVVAPDAPDGIAFEELLWGVQVQPVKPSVLQSRTLVTNALTTTTPESQTFLRDKDHYKVVDVDGLRFERSGASVSAFGGADPVCELSLGASHLSERRWLFGPGAAEVFKPPVGEGGKALRYGFTFLGLNQILRPGDLAADATFRFHPHALFGELFASAEKLVPIEIAVSRPGTIGIQLLTPSIPYEAR